MSFDRVDNHFIFIHQTCLWEKKKEKWKKKKWTNEQMNKWTKQSNEIKWNEL